MRKFPIALIATIITFGYLLPGAIAYYKETEKNNLIGFVNLITGWTLLGWVGCLIWAFYDKPGTESEEDKELEMLRKQAEIRKLKQELQELENI